MNKIIVALAILVAMFFTSGSAYGQFVDFGVKGGLNIAHISGDGSADHNNKIGFGIGGMANISMTGLPLSIQLEVLYLQKGATLNTIIFGERYESTLSLDYLEVPVLAVVDIPVAGPVNPFVYAGPYLAFNINAESDATYLGLNETEDIREEVKSNEVGISFGAGTNVSLGVMKLVLDLRYSFGILDMSEFTGEDVKNNGLSLTTGIRF